MTRSLFRRFFSRFFRLRPLHAARPWRPLRPLDWLEARDTPALAIVPGTPLNDIITVENLSGTTVAVTVASFADAGYTQPVATTTVTVDGTDGVFLAAGAGDDTVKIVGNVPLNVRTRIAGGPGNDTVAVFAATAQPIDFEGGDGSDGVKLFRTVFAPSPVTFFASDSAVARADSAAVFYRTAEYAVINGGATSDTLVVGAGLSVPLTFVVGGGSVFDSDSVQLNGTAGDDLFFVSDAGLSRAGDQAVFLSSGSTGQQFLSVTVAGLDGDDRLSATAGLLSQVGVRPFDGVQFDGGAGADTVFLNGTAGNDLFYVSGLNVLRDIAVLLPNVEAATIYGYGGDDTLVVNPNPWYLPPAPRSVGFVGGDGQDTLVIDTRGQTVADYVFTDAAAFSPTVPFPVSYDSVESRRQFTS